MSNEPRESSSILKHALSIARAGSAFSYNDDGILTCASPTTCSGTAQNKLTLTLKPGNRALSVTSIGSVTDSYDCNAYGELASYIAKYSGSSMYSVAYDDNTGIAPESRDALGLLRKKTEVIDGSTSEWQYEYDWNSLADGPESA